MKKLVRNSFISLLGTIVEFYVRLWGYRNSTEIRRVVTNDTRVYTKQKIAKIFARQIELERTSNEQVLQLLRVDV